VLLTFSWPIPKVRHFNFTVCVWMCRTRAALIISFTHAFPSSPCGCRFSASKFISIWKSEGKISDESPLSFARTLYQKLQRTFELCAQGRKALDTLDLDFIGMNCALGCFLRLLRDTLLNLVSSTINFSLILQSDPRFHVPRR
jgi:hypothetical protein